MRRTDICLYLGPANRGELQALLTNRNTPSKLTWRAGMVLATAEGVGTVEIMRRTGMSKPTVWRGKTDISMKACQGSSTKRRGPRE